MKNLEELREQAYFNSSLPVSPAPTISDDDHLSLSSSSVQLQEQLDQLEFDKDEVESKFSEMQAKYGDILTKYTDMKVKCCCHSHSRCLVCVCV